MQSFHPTRMLHRQSGRLLYLAIVLLIMTRAVDASAQIIRVKVADYPTLGNPTSAIETSDGRYVFVSVTNVGAPNFAGPDAAAGSRKDVVAGIQIFRVKRHKLIAAGFLRTGGAGANGLVLLPGDKTLAMGVGDDGVVFLDVPGLLSGTAVPKVISQGEKAGTFDIAVTPDGKYIFAANEYGVIDGQRGNVGIVATGIDREGRILNPKKIRQIPVGDVVPSLTISHDGKRVYVATELVLSNKAVAIAGETNPILTRSDCVQKKGTPAWSNGFISVIDVELATGTSPTENPIAARVAAGCSPVRLAESADGSFLFVTARGDNAVFQYNAAILSTGSEHSFLRAIPSGGEAPVGLRLFDGDRLLAVANSNRFASTPGNLAIFAVGKSPALLQTLPTGLFPRNIGTSALGRELLLTNYSSRTFSLIQVSVLSSSRP